jgi:hypothetical protein
MPTQSLAAAHAGGLGGEVPPPPLPPPVPVPGGEVPPPLPVHELPHTPLKQPLAAQEPSAQSWHSWVKGPQSLSLLQVPGPGGGGLGALHERTQAPLTHAVPAQVPSAQIWQIRVSTQSVLAEQAGGAGGELGQVIWHWPLMHAGAAQLPSEQGEHSIGAGPVPTQSASTLQTAGGGGGVGGPVGPQVNWQVFCTQASAAQVPFEHCGQAPTAGQSASV